MSAYRSIFLFDCISDHYPTNVSIVEERCKFKKFFQFCNMWAQHPQFNALVREGWADSIEGCKMYQVVKKLKLLKKKLKVLKSQYSHDIVREAEEDRKFLKQRQLKLQRDPSSVEIQQAESLAYQKFKQSSYLAEMYLQQRSKAAWIKLGDDNARYFYLIIEHRKLKHLISSKSHLYLRL
ncbi:uncharacterized protein [Nicotiana sylvestris]|uniref:uncharacterized protein n=1 Tax=Nicotiana sylvestris TaxID=4096 RepID=UPI00388C3DF2